MPLATATRDNLHISGFIKVNTRTIIKNVNKVHKDSNQFHLSTQCEMQGLQTVTMLPKFILQHTAQLLISNILF